MASTVICPNCSRQVEVGEQYFGQSIYCPQCGKLMAIPAPTATVVGYARFDSASPASVQYAGFWIRFAASFIDTFVTLIPAVIANAVIPFVGGLSVWIIYKGLCLANWNGQTVGKRACGIRVVDESLRPCTVGQAFGRTIAEFLSTLILLIGYIMAGFDPRKQALHDKMAGTLHVYSPRTTIS
mgnify:CR=1 FL=1